MQEIASKFVRVYPSDYKKLDRQVKKRRTTMAHLIRELLASKKL